MERLIREIKAAKRRGINVDEVFVDYEGRLKKLDAQLFGLRCAICFTFISPLVLYGMKIYCLANKIEIELPEQAINNFCLANAGTMIAYGFGSGLHRVIKELRRRKLYEELEKFGPKPDDDDDFDGAGKPGRS